MRAHTKEMLKKAHGILKGGIPVSGKDLAKACGLKVSSAYRMIRMLREDGVGIVPTKKGYLPSNAVEKRDIVGWTRKLLGRRTSDALAVGAAYKDIVGIWHGQERVEFLRAISYVVPNPGLTSSMKFIESKSKSLGI